jgi:hypothetical protein
VCGRQTMKKIGFLCLTGKMSHGSTLNHTEDGTARVAGKRRKSDGNGMNRQERRATESHRNTRKRNDKDGRKEARPADRRAGPPCLFLLLVSVVSFVVNRRFCSSRRTRQKEGGQAQRARRTAEASRRRRGGEDEMRSESGTQEGNGSGLKKVPDPFVSFVSPLFPPRLTTTV